MAVSVHEITIVAPNLIRVEVRDPPVDRGTVVAFGIAQSGSFNTWTQYTNPDRANITDWGAVVGIDKKHVRFQDIRATSYLDRDAARVAANYGTIGGLTVTTVRYQNWPYDHGWWDATGATTGSGFTKPSTSMAHWLYLKLSGNLAQGAHTITYPAGTGLSPSSFTWSDTSTRCCQIHSSFAGHRPDDVCKRATFSLWVPGEGTEGQLNTPSDYSLTTFQIINAGGNVVWNSGSISLIIAPSTADFLNSQMSVSTDPAATHKTTLASTTQAPLTVVSITSATPAVVTFTGNTVANGDVLRCGVLSGASFSGTLIKVANVNGGAGTFEVTNLAGTNLSGAGYSHGAFSGIAADVIFKTHTPNLSGTYVYALDYSAFEPTTLGLYRIRIPGLGVSDPIRFDDAVWHELAAILDQGKYHQRASCALDGRFGYTRGVAIRDGVVGVEIYKSHLPAPFSNQGIGIGQNVAAEWSALSAWRSGVNTRIDAGGEYMDAADWDVFPWGHTYIPIRDMNLFDILSEGSRRTNFNIPLSSGSAVLGSSYSELDGLPDLIHDAVWALAWMRRCQESDGRVPGGMEGSSQSFIAEEASDLAMSQWVTFAPDHHTNFVYAGAAAMLGRILLANGAPVLGQAFLDSAELAWDWANDVYLKLTPESLTLTGGSGTYTIGETITGGTSGATAIVYPHANFNGGAAPTGGTTTVKIRDRVGTFQAAETITGGTSGAARAFSAIVTNASFDRDYYYEALTKLKQSFTVTGDVASGSAVITNVSDTSALIVGQQISGTGLLSNTCIKSIDSATQITLRRLSDTVAKDGTVLISTSANASASNTGVTLTISRPNGTVASPLQVWTAAQYDNAVARLQAYAAAPRQFAAAALMRALGRTATDTLGTQYRSYYETDYTKTNYGGYDAWGQWEYYQGADSVLDSVLRATIKASIISAADAQLSSSENASNAYRVNATGLFQQVTWVGGQSGPGVTPKPIWAHIFAVADGNTSLANRRLSQMMAALALAHGANQQGISFTRGVGPRHVMGNLHDDSWHTGLAGGPIGITAYSYNGTLGGATQRDVAKMYANNTLSSLNDVYNPANTANFDDKRVVEPFRHCMPMMQNFIDHRWAISESEYGLEQMSAQQSWALYLHGQDGNDITRLSPDGIRRRPVRLTAVA